MIKNLEGNWLDISKLTWEIWQILTQELESLKNLHFNGLLLTKVYNVLAKKVQRSYVLIALKIVTNFEGKIACVSENWHEEFGKFSPEHLEISKLGPWWHLLV